MTQPLLAVDKVCRNFGGLTALDGSTLKVLPGQICGLIGPNGSGKSTLFNVITGFLAADAGSIAFCGMRIDGMPPNRIAGLGMARTFQSDRLPGRMTALEVLLLAPPGQVGESIWGCVTWARVVRDQEKGNLERALEVLENLGLADKANAEVSELSGGQRKLLALGQAVMRGPKLLLLDEPVAGVNPVLINTIEQKLRELGKNILIVEHNIQVIRRVCDWVYVMDAGKVIAHGTPDEVLRQDRVLQAYLARSNPQEPGA